MESVLRSVHELGESTELEACILDRMSIVRSYPLKFKSNAYFYAIAVTSRKSNYLTIYDSIFEITISI